MTFVYPSFLWALFALALPIAIHLFNFRRYKKIYFSNVKFLKDLLDESKSKSRLKEILVLICRCLAVAALVLAFSQPLIPSKNTTTKNSGIKAISIYIDNSFSMESVNKQGPLLEIAKTRAKEIVRAFNNSDKFQIITNDFEGRHQRFNYKEEALDLIDEIKVSPSGKLVTNVLKRQSDFLRSSEIDNKRIFCISDAQKSTFNLKDFVADTLIDVTLVPLKANAVNNVSVDSCWFSTPVQQRGMIQKLKARIVNYGNNTISLGSAKLFLNKKQIALASFSLEPNIGGEVQFTFECKEEGFNFGSIKIEDYPVTFDDELYFAFNASPNIAIALINGKKTEAENSVSSLFKSDSLFQYSVSGEQTIDYNTFKTSDVVVLNQLENLSSGLVLELQKFSAKGGAIIIIPAAEADVNSYNNAFAVLKLPQINGADSTVLKTDKIEFASGFYSGVFEKAEDRMNLPLVNRHYKFQKTSQLDFESILSLANGDVLLGKSKLDNASVFLFSTTFNGANTNFDKHAIFVPTVYRICFSGLKNPALFNSTGSNVAIQLKNDAGMAEQPPHIIEQNNKTDIIPEMRVVNNAMLLYTHEQIKLPGFYEVVRNTKALLPLAFNYQRVESDLKCYTEQELATLILDKAWKKVSLVSDTDTDISPEIALGNEGKKLWKLFIILTLIFITIEVVLLRVLK